MIWHVCVTGNDSAAGTAQAPFRTINRAARAAAPGDTVQVHNGVYREWVDPPMGGTSDDVRITFEAAPGEHPVIKGSEAVTGWEQVEGTVWKKVLPNAMFGDFNPYQRRVEGDWFSDPKEYPVHLGDVYINGRSMYEASSMEDLYAAPRREKGCVFEFNPYGIRHPEYTVYRWYAQVNDENTVIFGNFQELDPNQVLTEINVRPYCFYPAKTGIHYITLRGFEIAQAACPFTPPTADQPGMVGPHWSKGWIIEDNHLHDAKCSAISLGKEISTGDNESTRFGKKTGYQCQLETVFRAVRDGWSNEIVGAHIVRNNLIHDCGQNGVVGHLGGICSRIEHNHIYNIGSKQEFNGHEIAGIKLHAAIDAVLENNYIHHCHRFGIWLDWQAQGMRVTGNICHENACDLFIEVSHGPCVLDHNVFLSDFSLQIGAQGTAFAHNIFRGRTRHFEVTDRSTPYHFPHSTQVAGCAFVHFGDDRLMNNIYLGKGQPEVEGLTPFHTMYDSCSTPEEYASRLEAVKNDPLKYHQKYKRMPQSVYASGNVYGGEAKPCRQEKALLLCQNMDASVQEQESGVYLTFTVPEALICADCEPVTTQSLGTTRITEAQYENPDGTPLELSVDITGTVRSGRILPGPFAELQTGVQTIKVF